MTEYCPICKSTHTMWYNYKDDKWYCGKCGYILTTSGRKRNCEKRIKNERG